jgi:hypothetical protein
MSEKDARFSNYYFTARRQDNSYWKETVLMRKLFSQIVGVSRSILFRFLLFFEEKIRYLHADATSFTKCIAQNNFWWEFDSDSCQFLKSKSYLPSMKIITCNLWLSKKYKMFFAFVLFKNKLERRSNHYFNCDKRKIF